MALRLTRKLTVQTSTLCAVSIPALLALTSAAAAQCRYDVQIISAGPCGIFGPQPTVGTAINSNGDICGWHCACICANYDRAFLWTNDGRFLTLPHPPDVIGSDAFALNDSGQIAGTFEVSGQGHRAFFWQHGQWQNLPIPPAGTNSEAFSINNAGEVAGYWANFGYGPFHASVWRNGLLIDLNPSFGTPYSIATGINAHSQVTGWMGTSPNVDSRAFIWSDGKVTNLGPIPGGITSDGRAINDRGDVAGTGVMKGLVSGTLTLRGFVWIDGEMTLVNPLSGYDRIAAFDINNSRQVVGYCAAKRLFDHGFIWQGGQMADLNDLIDPELDLTIDWASEINDAGQIAGTASGPIGQVVAVLLTPVEAIAGDLNHDGVVNTLDLGILLVSWSIPPPSPGCQGAPRCVADLNGDGLVNSLDLGILLVNWSIIS